VQATGGGPQMNRPRDGILVFLAWGLTMAVLLVGLSVSSRPRLILRASPRVAVAPARIYLRALIQGEITEEWYCPAVSWTWPGGASREEPDCPPWVEGREDAQVIWTQHVTLGAGEHQQLGVEMSKAGRVLGSENVEVSVR
jgi:hypothetical protein